MILLCSLFLHCSFKVKKIRKDADERRRRRKDKQDKLYYTIPVRTNRNIIIGGIIILNTNDCQLGNAIVVFKNVIVFTCVLGGKK